MNDSGEYPAKVRILVLDEQPLLRYGISAYLNSQPDMVVCGEAESISAAQKQIGECNPQLLLTSLRLGADESLGFVKTLKAERPGLLVLVYSAFDESIFAERATRAGAAGYVMKNAPSEELPAAIRDVVKRGIYVSREVGLSAFKKSLQQRRKDNRVSRSANWVENLSGREMQIFQLLGAGLGNKQIADSLELSVRTVETHRENIKHKLNVRSGAELRQRAIKWVAENFCVEEHAFRGPNDRTKRKVTPFAMAQPM
jgi:DNA-binding NarL/FixJ family response regulator